MNLNVGCVFQGDTSQPHLNFKLWASLPVWTAVCVSDCRAWSLAAVCALIPSQYSVQPQLAEP
jgi:hypothetical protein